VFPAGSWACPWGVPCPSLPVLEGPRRPPEPLLQLVGGPSGGLGQLSLAGLSATPLLLGAGQVRWRRWGSWVRHPVNGETVSRGFGHSVGFQVFDVNSEDLLSGRGSEVVHHWREDFRDGVRAGVFGS
jgi:hypothetical protein